MNLYKSLLLSSLLFTANSMYAEDNTRWQISSDKSIVWNGNIRIPHNDHIEMSGKSVSTVLRLSLIHI